MVPDEIGIWEVIRLSSPEEMADGDFFVAETAHLYLCHVSDFE